MRRTLGLSILWAFAGNLCAAAEIPVKPHFKSTLLMGKWFPIALVTDYGGMDHLSTVGRFILAMPPHGLTVDFDYIEDKECYIEIAYFWHTEKPGQFITESYESKLNGYKVHIVDTNYDEYNIFHMGRDGKNTLILDATENTVSAAVRQKFEDWASALGFSVDKILNVPNNDYCHQGKQYL